MHMFRLLAATAVTTLAFSSVAFADEFDVQMLNKGEAGVMVFEPAFLQIQPGDVVNFVSVDRGHNTESIKDLIPAGARPFKGGMNKDVSVPFDVEGAYAIKCLPHLAMGMVAVIVVGENPANLADLEDARLPSKARQRLDDALAQL